MSAFALPGCRCRPGGAGVYTHVVLGGWRGRKVRQAPGSLGGSALHGQAHAVGVVSSHRLPESRPFLHGALGNMRDAPEHVLAASDRQQHGALESVRDAPEHALAAGNRQQHGALGKMWVQSRLSLWQMGSIRSPESHQAASGNTMSVWDCSGLAAGADGPLMHLQGSKHALQCVTFGPTFWALIRWSTMDTMSF